MRVAHFIHRYPPAIGGAEAYFARLSRYLVGLGHQTTVFTTNAIDLQAFWSGRAQCCPPGVIVEQGVEVRRYPLNRWFGQRYMLKALSMIPHRTWQCLTMPCNPISAKMWLDTGRLDRSFDIVHATAFPNAFPIVCGLRLARRLRVPFLLTPFIHFGDLKNRNDRTRRKFTNPALLSLVGAADRVFVQTQLEQEVLSDCGIHSRQIVQLGLGVDPQECTGGERDGIRREWNIAAGEVVIGHLANNSAEKGTIDLLRAAQVLWDAKADFRVVLAGPEMPNFQQFWRNYPRQAGVIRLGVLGDRQKRDFFAGLDVFALPSRADSFGLVLLEAWANGLPNVAYRAGGPAELIRDGEDGLLVGCADQPALAARLLLLIRDRELRYKLGNCGRSRIEKEFRWENKLKKVAQTYAETANRQRQQG